MGIVKDQKVLETSVITETTQVKDLDVTVVPTPVEEQKHIVEAGHVILTVHKARDIEKKGMFGKADPYVNITFGKQKAKSKTIKNNHNPEWNFNATFEVDQNTSETIRIEVFDEDLGKDDTLGHKVMDINSVVKQKKLLNQWIPLDNCKSGEILLSAEFIPIADIQKSKQIEKPVASEPSPVQPKENDSKPKVTTKDTKEPIPVSETPEKMTEDILVPESTVSETKRKLESGRIHITVIKAKDIEKKGKFGKADPYVKMTLGEQKAKSATVKNNHNPEWNFEATFDINENSPQALDIAVFDDDFGKDDTLGNKTIDINHIQENKKMLNQWIPLENCKSGEVLLSAEFIPLASLQKSEDIDKSLAPKPTKDDLKQIEPKAKESIDVQDTTAVKEVVEESETTKQEKIIVKKTEEVKQELVQDSKITESIDSVEAAASTKVETLPEKGAMGLKEVLNKEKKVSFEVVVQSDKSVEVVKPKDPKVVETSVITEAAQVKELDVAVVSTPVEEQKHIVEAGHVILTVHKARDIEKKGMFGKADPYVNITFGKQKAKSKTVNNNHNPEWNFNATFEVDQNTSETIRIEVFDEDLGKDDTLGHKDMDINSVVKQKKLLNQWIPLDNCKSGEILLSAEFIPIADIQKSKQIEKPVASEASHVQDTTAVKEVVEELETTKQEKIIVKKTEEVKHELVQ